VHLFPAYDGVIHSGLSNITFHTFSTARPADLDPSVRLHGPYPLRRGAYRAERLANRFFPERMTRAGRLASLIARLKPDVIHSMELQTSSYLTLEARKLLGGSFPQWFVSSWGNDLYLFGRLAHHAPKIREVLECCDYFTADCERDIELARQFGFKRESFPALPGAGGFDIELAKRLRSANPPSSRRVITLKGYQSTAGRALTGLRAIEICREALRAYKIAVYFSTPEIDVAAELTAQRTGLQIEIVPRGSYEDSLRMHGAARVSVGVSISDGLPLSVMEAALMGSFPVQTNTSCVGEWLRDGETTLLVPPDDPEIIAQAILRAATDDTLVDSAAEKSFQYIAENLNLRKVGMQVIAMYERIQRTASPEKSVPSKNDFTK
jgi:glycosyltransferase involved in cell wall biosynthesis